MQLNNRDKMIFLFLLLLVPLTVNAVNDQPLEESWAPSEWGADDLVGAVNRTTPDIVLAATKLVKQGKVISLGLPVEPDV